MAGHTHLAACGGCSHEHLLLGCIIRPCNHGSVLIRDRSNCMAHLNRNTEHKPSPLCMCIQIITSGLTYSLIMYTSASTTGVRPHAVPVAVLRALTAYLFVVAAREVVFTKREDPSRLIHNSCRTRCGGQVW